MSFLFNANARSGFVVALASAAPSGVPALRVSP